MLLNGRSWSGPDIHFQFDDAAFAWNVASDAVARLLQADVVPEAPPEEWRQDLSELALMAQQGKTWESWIIRNGRARVGLGRLF